MADSDNKQPGVSGNQDWRATSGRRQMHQAVDRGSLPQGVVLMDKKEVAQVMHQIIDSWKPAKEVYDRNHFCLHLNICRVLDWLNIALADYCIMCRLVAVVYCYSLTCILFYFEHF